MLSGTKLMLSLYQGGFDPVKLQVEPTRLQPNAE
jgi:hypothetical protein